MVLLGLVLALLLLQSLAAPPAIVKWAPEKASVLSTAFLPLLRINVCSDRDSPFLCGKARIAAAVRLGRFAFGEISVVASEIIARSFFYIKGGWGEGLRGVECCIVRGCKTVRINLEIRQRQKQLHFPKTRMLIWLGVSLRTILGSPEYLMAASGG